MKKLIVFFLLLIYFYFMLDERLVYMLMNVYELTLEILIIIIIF